MLLGSLAVALPFLLFAQQESARIACGGGEPKVVASTAGDKGVLRFEGGCVVTYQNMRVESDWAEYNPETKQLTAGDKVHFQRGTGEDLRGGILSLDTETKSGTLSDASGELEGWYLISGETERMVDGKWYFKKPRATACSGECPTWHFTWREAVVTPGENFTGRGMALRFRNVPVFYFPKVSVPTTSKERSSGFLMPSIAGSTTKGRSIREAFYWVLGRSYDVTLTGEYYTKQGITGTIDFRGLPGERTSVDVNTLFAPGKDNEQDKTKGVSGYRTHIRTVSNFGDNWRGVVNADITSGFEFRQIYEQGFNVISSPIEQSVGFLTRNGSRWSTNFLYGRTGVFYQEAPGTMIRKFPAADLQLATNDIGGRIPVYFSLEGGVTGAARRDSEVSTPPAMQRLDIHPTIEIPLLTSSLLTWSHQLGVRETLYSHSLEPGGVDQTALNRGVFDYTMRIVGPQLERSFGSWRHLVEPTIKYRYVAGVHDFRETIIVDEADLITNTNEIEYGITNRFFSNREFLTWRIAQKMYFDPTFGGALVAGRRNTLEPLMDLTGFAFSDGEPRRFSPIVSTVKIATTAYTSTDIQVDYDTKREEFRAAGILGNMSRGNFNSSVGYFFNKRSDIQPPSNQLRALVSYGSYRSPGLSAGMSFSYDIFHSLFQGATSQVNYNAECFGLGFEVTKYALGARREFGWRASLSLKNLGFVGTLRPQERLF
jgi:LPS-assembly protein